MIASRHVPLLVLTIAATTARQCVCVFLLYFLLSPKQDLRLLCFGTVVIGAVIILISPYEI